MTPLRVGLIGYGEVGRAFGAALARVDSCAVAAFDVQAGDEAWAETARTRAARDAVSLVAIRAEAVSAADLVISAVTAEATLEAARELGEVLKPPAYVLDVNSASPRTKSSGAELIAGCGGRYVEAAVMSPVSPLGIRVPMLLGGPYAHEVKPLLDRLGFAATVGSPRYGVVSAIKLCRSIIVKGTEALVIESLLAARRYGVEAEVLASLGDLFPGVVWEKHATYLWRRVVQHGRRRAEEMREAAATVRDVQVASRMASATAETQAWVAAMQAEGLFADVPSESGWRGIADRIEPARDAGSGLPASSARNGEQTVQPDGVREERIAPR